MKEGVISVMIVGAFIVASYYLHKYMRNIKSIIWFLSVILMYIVMLYGYFEIINKIHQYLRDRGIYIEFGHASILLIELGVICLFFALINIVWAAVSRYRNLQVKNTSPNHT